MMNFEAFSGYSPSRRKQAANFAPAIVESLETRTLLAAPQVISPDGTITNSTPVVRWQAVENAQSYDVWVSDVETRQRIFYRTGLSNTTVRIPKSSELHLGQNRIWVRANFADGTTTGWGDPRTILLKVAPTVTGPVNTAKPKTPLKIEDTTPEIAWISPPGARSFEVFLSHQTEQNSTTYIVRNLTPKLDNDGNTIPDGNGDVVREEIRKLELTDDLRMGKYQIFMRTTDDAGRVSPWSYRYSFEISPAVNILRPSGPTFQNTQKIRVTVNGSPTSGTYRLDLSRWNLTGTGAQTYRTAPLEWNASSIDVRNAVRALPGFGKVEVTTSGISPNVSHVIQLNGVTNVVTATAEESLDPGTVIVSTAPADGILLQWKPVAAATHYEVWVNKADALNSAPSMIPAQFVTETSFRIPRLLQDGDYKFAVRARRLNQVTEIKLSGFPTSGSYQLKLTSNGPDGPIVQTTDPVAFSATTEQLKAAINLLEGFEDVFVITAGTSPNLTHLLEIPQVSGPVTVELIGSVSPGEIAVLTRQSQQVLGLWSGVTNFSTIKDPVITAPVGVPTNNSNARTVTDVRPTLEWTAIDQTARYEIWVDRTASSDVYLKTISSTNSYTFAEDIQPGNYWVWVRAISTTGQMTKWSLPYKFTATGGAPLITSPVNNQSVVALPTIEWAGVPNAVSYEIQIAWLGVDFDYIQRSGITTEEFTPDAPLNSGSYRVWVRAVLEDGTKLRWSAPISFVVVKTEVPAEDAEGPRMTSLPPLLNPHQLAKAEVIRPAEKDDEGSADGNSPEVNAHPQPFPVVPAQRIQDPAMLLDSQLDSQLIHSLASQCVTEEWWTSAEAGQS